MMPNRMVIGIGTWAVLRHHPKVIARQPGSANIGITLQQLSAMLMVPLEIRLGVLSKDTAKAGKAKNAVNIVGDSLYIYYASQSPTQYDPSFCKTFRIARGGVASVREYREERNRSDILAVDWTEDVKITALGLCRRITLS